jgi:hypothetical protein
LRFCVPMTQSGRKCGRNVDEVWTRCGVWGGFGRLNRVLTRVGAKRGTRPDPLPVAATLSDRLSPSTGVPLLAPLGHFFDLWRLLSSHFRLVLHAKRHLPCLASKPAACAFRYYSQPEGQGQKGQNCVAV